MKRHVFQGLTFGAWALLAAPLALAHPGHDHSHADHAVHELPAQTSGDIAPMIGALIAVGIIVLAIRAFGKTRHNRR